MPFHAIAKEEIERFGGALDKFIGDAAMGVFGAPVAHEDDAERAVRAALAIQARAAEMAIPVRAAVNTGEAVVTFATGPQVGENVAGDVVNTASRLQSDGSARWRRGRRVTFGRRAGRCDTRSSSRSRSRARRSRCASGSWSRSARRRPADPMRMRRRSSAASESVSLLHELFDRSARESSLQLVTVVGEPGIGKTRLVADLRDRVSPTQIPSRGTAGDACPTASR